MARDRNAPITYDDLEWWLELAPTLHWTFASSMPDCPHNYVVKGKRLGDEDFYRAVGVIRTFGQPGKFWNSTNIYLTHRGMKWWTMGASRESTTIINQATTEKVYGRQDAVVTKSGIPNVHDGIATVYDDRYMDAEAHMENSRMVGIVRQHFGPMAPRTLDVGCGTGLLLDLGATAPGMFTGVDPSQGMLNELVRKHPRVKDLYPARMEDMVDQFASDEFELVTAWFGSASHLPADTINAVAKMSSSLLMLMCYVEGYLPDYYDDPVDSPYLKESREAARALPGAETFVMNNFEVTVVRSE